MDCVINNENGLFRYNVRAIIIEEDCLLMVKNKKVPFMYTVGGGVHIRERAEDALKREIMEETGSLYEIDRLAFIHEYFFEELTDDERIQGHNIELHFLMKPKGKKSPLVCESRGMNDAKESLCWIPLAELSNHFFYPEFYKEKLMNLKDGIEHIVTYQ